MNLIKQRQMEWLPPIQDFKEAILASSKVQPRVMSNNKNLIARLVSLQIGMMSDSILMKHLEPEVPQEAREEASTKI